MREQFGLRPKQQSVTYKAPYPPAYNQIPLPHKYKMPDFTKFSGQGEVYMIEHVNRFLLQLGEAVTMMHSESVCSPCLCLDRPLLGTLLCQQIPYYIGPIWRDNFINFSTLGLLNWSWPIWLAYCRETMNRLLLSFKGSEMSRNDATVWFCPISNRQRQHLMGSCHTLKTNMHLKYLRALARL